MAHFPLFSVLVQLPISWHYLMSPRFIQWSMFLNSRNMFHLLQQVEEDITLVPTDPEVVVQPVQLTGAGMVLKGASAVAQIQVCWSSQPSSLSTWEEANDLRRRYPANPAWGQAGIGGGNVKYRCKGHGTVGCPATGGKSA